MGKPKISLDRVSKSFASRGKPISALEGVSMEVMEGEFACVVGPSGCGKSTLLSIIAGLETQDSGTVRVDGRPVSGTGTDRILIFQDGALFPWLTVSGNIEFGLKMAGMEKSARKAKAAGLLRMMHLTRFANSGIHELSGGMRQRVAIARALAMDPEILLMDEPFAALDAQTRDGLHEELTRIWRETGKTIVFVTHNVSEAARLGDRVIVF
ncbi:MAG: ABC transporter ATP-binding protein, partial [Candidatus ainarchaeum sp.]|nr:ABC transporter ATP-binding protein [Candidatus ainarchaeum sp.]